MLHATYIARKLAFNDDGELVWALGGAKGKPAAHDRGNGPVVRLADHDYPADDVVNALLKGTGLATPAKQPRAKWKDDAKLPKSGHRYIQLHGRGKRLRYLVIITMDGKQKGFGRFKTLDEAIAARDAALQ